MNPFMKVIGRLQRAGRRTTEDTNEQLSGLRGPSPKFRHPLRNMTPHLLAATMLQSVREDGQRWRETDPVALAAVTASVPMTCEFYQLSIFFELIARRFGENVQRLCEASLLAIISRANYPDFYTKFKLALTKAKAKCGYDLIGSATELDIEIARQFLLLFSESEESKRKLLHPLATSLSYARIWAETCYPAIVSELDFDPLSIALVEIETSYRGTSTIWQPRPGCFERQLQRMEGNPLYDDALRRPSEIAVLEARAKDMSDLRTIEARVALLLADFRKLGSVGGVQNRVLIELLEHQLEPLLVRCAEVGLPAQAQSKTLTNILETTLNAIGLDETNREELRKTRAFRTNQFIAQQLRKDGPIPKDGFVEALLAEDIETIAGVLSAYSEQDPIVTQELSELALADIALCELESFKLPGLYEKKELFTDWVSLRIANP